MGRKGYQEGMPREHRIPRHWNPPRLSNPCL
jgi:hypothetical protein